MSRIIFLLFITLAFRFPCHAHLYMPPEPLPKVVQSADIVAVAEVADGGSKTALYTGRTQQIQNEVSLSLIYVLKGVCPENFKVPLGDIDSFYYPRDFSMAKGDQFLVILVQNGKSIELKKDTASLIKLSVDVSRKTLSKHSVTLIVEELLGESLKKESLKESSVFFLSQFDSVSAMQILAPYINDKNDKVADYALSCFARNQQASAIPLIVTRCQSFDFGGTSVPLISDYHVKEAKPFLERAMFGYPSGIRLNSVLALSRLADKNSVPYLLLGMFDQDPQKFVAPYCCGILHKVLPDLSNKFSFDQYEQQKKSEQQLFLTWWRDELAGKHPHKEDDKDRIVLNESEAHEAKEVPQLNEGLFMRSQYTRLAAVEALNKLADESSVPYLIIALRDPNGDVAYGAHHVLARLVPALGPYLPRATFDASRDQLAEAGVKWWVKHLQDAEEARLPEFMRTANKIPAK